jgi:hypothetical protein
MGCDYHPHIEMQATDGTWHRAEDIVPDPWYDPNEPVSNWNQPEVRDQWGKPGRNYELFTMLAGVRGPEHMAITPPRGIPDDVGDETRAEYEAWSIDAHTPTWYTARELAANSEGFKAVGAEWFVTGVIDRMIALADEELGGDPDKIRCIIFFDN